MVIETIGLGMVASFVLTETVGLAAGGIVVPGYFALALSEPWRVAGTLAVALVVFGLLKLLDRFVLLYGRRLMLLAVLLGYVLGYLTRVIPPLHFGDGQFDLSIIGFVIPGLVAYWMHRQGVVETLATLAVTAVLTRLVVTVISGGVA